MAKLKKANKKALMKRCAEEWSRVVREIAGYKCENCGSTKRVQAHHVFAKKSHPSVRYDISNGVCLCYYCHIILLHSQGNQDIVRKVESQRRQGWYDRLRGKAKQGDCKHDYDAVYNLLRGMHSPGCDKEED